MPAYIGDFKHSLIFVFLADIGPKLHRGIPKNHFTALAVKQKKIACIVVHIYIPDVTKSSSRVRIIFSKKKMECIVILFELGFVWISTASFTNTASSIISHLANSKEKLKESKWFCQYELHLVNQCGQTKGMEFIMRVR